MGRTRKPKIVSVTRPVFEIYENKYELMATSQKVFTSNDVTKTIDYLIQTKDSMLLKSAVVKIDKDGMIPESEEHHLFEVEQQDGFYAWIKHMYSETVEMVEEPKPKPVEEDPVRKKRTRKKR